MGRPGSNATKLLLLCIYPVSGLEEKEGVCYMTYQGLFWFVCRLTLRTGGKGRWGVGTEMEGHGLRLPVGYASLVPAVWTCL